jgi:hypothetical protein
VMNSARIGTFFSGSRGQYSGIEASAGRSPVVCARVTSLVSSTGLRVIQWSNR